MKKRKLREMKVKYYESLKKLNIRIEEDKNVNKIEVPKVKELKDYTKKELIKYASDHNITIKDINKMKKGDIVSVLEGK